MGGVKRNLWFSFSLIGSVGIVTATPAVGLGLLGHYLDERYHTSPKIFIVLILLALAISLLALRKIVKDAIKQLEEINKK